MPVVKIKTKTANIAVPFKLSKTLRGLTLFGSLCRNQDPSPGGGC